MKRVIPFALLLSVAGFAQAQSSYTLYGLIDASYGKSIADDVANLKADFHSGGDAQSGEGNSATRIGIKGSADLGSGVKANFKFETGGIDSDGDVNPTGAFFNRQAWFGLSGAFGELRLGRQDSVPFQTTIDFDFNGASNGVSALGYASVAPWAPGRQSRSLQYISPTFGGFKAQVGFVPKANTAADSTFGEAKDVYSIGLTFATGPVAVALTAQSKEFKDSKSFAAIAGSYDFGVAKFSLNYTDGGKKADGGYGKGFGVGVTVPVAGFNIGGIYGKSTDKSLAAFNKGSAYELFVNKEVYKNTYAYVEYGHADKKALGGTDAGNGYALGVIFTF
jgi:predicted porin